MPGGANRTNGSGIVARIVTVATSGIPVQGPDMQVPAGFEVIVKGHQSNTGIITVASSSADALNTSSNHDRLSASQADHFQIQNFNQLWFDATVNGEQVILAVEK